ncbi:MAG: hypothetical protein ACRDNW_16930 [Trebonia sp.]
MRRARPAGRRIVAVLRRDQQPRGGRATGKHLAGARGRACAVSSPALVTASRTAFVSSVPPPGPRPTSVNAPASRQAPGAVSQATIVAKSLPAPGCPPMNFTPRPPARHAGTAPGDAPALAAGAAPPSAARPPATA